MKFLYVQAVVRRVEVGDPDAVSFRHTTVDAGNDDEAYAKGQEWADAFIYKPREETVNDYVVCLG